MVPDTKMNGMLGNFSRTIASADMPSKEERVKSARTRSNRVFSRAVVKSFSVSTCRISQTTPSSFIFSRISSASSRLSPRFRICNFFCISRPLMPYFSGAPPAVRSESLRALSRSSQATLRPSAAPGARVRRCYPPIVPRRKHVASRNAYKRTESLFLFIPNLTGLCTVIAGYF